MRRSLQGKLILSYLVIALITVLVVSVLIRLNSGQSLMEMVVEQQTAQLEQSIQAYYTNQGSLEGFFEYYLTSIPLEPSQPYLPNPRPDSRELRGVTGLIDAENRAVLPSLGFEVGAIVPDEAIRQIVPVEVNGETIAYILPDTRFEFKLSAEEELFLQRTTLAIALAALAGVLAAVAMGYILSGRILLPIRRLTRASQALARGDLHQDVPVTSQDELGQLTATFNQMSTDLAQADQQRKRMTADITHDLSTPLQIISGYIEMLEEGEVNLSPQRIEIIKIELEHLRRLVNDLTLLTQAESDGLDIVAQPTQPADLLARIYQAYQPIASRQDIILAIDTPDSTPAILVDAGRMLQVLKNLVDNALRYTSPGGKITLSVVVDEQVQIRVTDTGSGIETEDLPYVFDRFYRADPARGANTGKMGLGLAICKALVVAQGGAITAESAGKDQGTTIVIQIDPLIQ